MFKKLRKIKLDRQFKKHLLIIFIIGILTAGFIEMATKDYMFMVPRKEHRCLPWIYYVLKKHVVPHEHGDLVSFKGVAIPRYPDGARMVKMVAGLPGDKIEVKVFSEEERDNNIIEYEKEGQLFKRRLQGRILIHRKHNSKTIDLGVIESDSLGEKLPMVLKDEVIPHGKMFVIGLYPRTYDSRYWGLIDEKQIIGQAYPLAFWKSTKEYL